MRKFYTVPCPQEEEVHSSSLENRCTHLAAHSSKRSKTLSAVMLVCLGKTSKKQDCKITALSPPKIHEFLNPTSILLVNGYLNK